MGQPASAVCLWMLAGLVSTGCAALPSRPCERTEVVALRLQAAHLLNPDRAGLPRSVVLRVFQLEEPDTFRAGTFESLWRAPKTSAVEDRVIVLPGQHRAHALRRNPSARYLAIAANFRQRRDARSWRALVRLPEARDPCQPSSTPRSRPVEVVLRDYSLLLRGAEPVAEPSGSDGVHAGEVRDLAQDDYGLDSDLSERLPEFDGDYGLDASEGGGYGPVLSSEHEP